MLDRDEKEEEVQNDMLIKEIFSFKNIARMHREIEQLKEVVRENRSYMIKLEEKVKHLEKRLENQDQNTYFTGPLKTSP
jgi:uncharacterized coiled-coil protein SlyX